MTSPSRIVARYKAARAIRLDKSRIYALAQELCMYLARRTPSAPWGDRVLLKGHPFKAQAVDGSPLTVYIQMKSMETDNFRYIVKGGFGKTPEGLPVVVVFLNGTIDTKKAAETKFLMKDLYQLLLHEITHAVDIYKPKLDLTEEESHTSEAYWNDPSEVRAYLQEIINEMPFKHWALLEQKFGPRKAVEYAMNMARTWGEIEPHLTEANRRLIIKAVVREYQDWVQEQESRKQQGVPEAFNPND